jgi:hypothetical protein
MDREEGEKKKVVVVVVDMEVVEGLVSGKVGFCRFVDGENRSRQGGRA